MASVCDVCGKKPIFGMKLEPLAPPYQAALEPEHPAGARDRERLTQAGERLHVVPEGRQGRQAVARRAACRAPIKMFDPATSEGIVVRDTDREEVVLAVERARRARSSACCVRASGSCSSSTPKAAPPGCAAAPNPTSACPPPRSSRVSRPALPRLGDRRHRRTSPAPGDEPRGARSREAKPRTASHRASGSSRRPAR